MKKKLEGLKPPPTEEGKEPEISVEGVPPTMPPPEKTEEAEAKLEEVKERIVKGKPLEKPMFKDLLDSGFDFLCDARPHLKRPSPPSIENLDDALVDFLNDQDLREWIGKHWHKLNLMLASGVIGVPLIMQELSHRREAKKEKKPEEKPPETPKEASVTVATTPTGETVTVTAKAPLSEEERKALQDYWREKLKGTG